MDESRMKYPLNLMYNTKIVHEMGPRIALCDLFMWMSATGIILSCKHAIMCRIWIWISLILAGFRPIMACSQGTYLSRIILIRCDVMDLIMAEAFRWHRPYSTCPLIWKEKKTSNRKHFHHRSLASWQVSILLTHCPWVNVALILNV